MKIIGGVLLLLVTSEAPPAARAPEWPRVTPLDVTFSNTAPAMPDVQLHVRDQVGRPLYLFICRNADDPRAGQINYAGDLDCRLIEGRTEREENLLIESSDPRTAAWYSRGRMFATELAGACATYPEYGLVRHFHLRGLTLTMTFSRVRFATEAPPTLASYRLRVTVVNNPAATRSIAASSGYLDPSVERPPKRSCDHMQRGREWD